MSITCALWAMMLQQSARRHLPVYSLPEEARIRAFFDDGRKVLDFRLAIACLNFLVQIALFMFFSGVFMYMFNINSFVAILSYSWVVVFAFVYACITILPVVKLNSPVSTAASPLLVFIWHSILHLHLEWRSFSWGLETWAAVHVQKQSSRFDGRILKQTLDALALRGDDDLELFFEAIPGFCNSTVVGDPPSSLDMLGRQRLAEVLVGFLERTMTSSPVYKAIQERRLVICVGVIKTAHLTITVLRILDVSRSPEIGRALASLYNSDFAPLARGITAGIISNAKRNHGWSTLAMDELGLSEDMYLEYLSQGDSILLANLNHLTRHFLDFFRQRCDDRDVAQEALCILPLVSNFSIHNTLPKLQQDFCHLWNMIVQHARNSRVDHDPFTRILDNIRPLYNALHPTDATTVDSSASPTNNARTHHSPLLRPDHRPNLHSDIHEAVGGTTDGSGQPPTSTSPISPTPMSSPNNVPVSRQHVSSPDVLASSCSSLPESQRPTIPPLSGTDVTHGILDTSLDLSIDRHIDCSSPSTNDAPRPNEGTTGIQTEIPSQQDPPTTFSR